MIEAVMFWNEPNNKSHWDFMELDPEWRVFSDMVTLAAEAVAAERPGLTRVLGGSLYDLLCEDGSPKPAARRFAAHTPDVLLHAGELRRAAASHESAARHRAVRRVLRAHDAPLCSPRRGSAHAAERHVPIAGKDLKTGRRCSRP